MSAAPFPPFELARKVADAVLYEGYLLYPYRASAAKNQARWQFGVLMPRLWSEDGPEEPWATQTECLLEPEDTATVRVLVRRTGEGFECYLVPIDACYELVGLVRMHWKGFDGGQEAWEAIDGFFDAVRERSRVP